MNSIFKAFRLAAIVLTICMTASCEKIFEPEGDCSSIWYVQFVYTKNPQALSSLTGVGADAFAQSVRSVHLYVYDSQTGNYVADYEAAGEELGSGSWRMPVDLAPGTYDLVAWCNGCAGANPAFEAVNSRAADDRESTGWRVKRDTYGRPWNYEAWNPQNALFYGEKVATVVTNETGEHTIVVELTKDTNHINVTVQFAQDVALADDFYVRWRDDNGTLDAHNRTVAGDELVYEPYREFTLTDDELLYDGTQIQAGTKYNYFGVSRLMADAVHDAESYLEVRRTSDDELLYGVNLIRLIRNMVHGVVDADFAGYGDDDDCDYCQYYLDCQDTYNCHFILQPDGGRWTVNSIHINNWVLVGPQKGPVFGE